MLGLGLGLQKQIMIGFNLGKMQPIATFTRPTPAYLSDGKRVAANVPRFEPGKFGKALMVEEKTTNLLVKDLDTGGSGSLIDILVPNKVWAKRITVEANNFFYLGTISVPAQPNTKYTLTCWARLVSGSVVSGTRIYIGSDSQGVQGVASLNIDTQLTSEWKKFVITGQTDANATTLTCAAFRVQTDTGCTVEIADWQLEAKPYATSFIDGTRAAETLTIPSYVLNPQEGTVACWVYVNSASKYPNRYSTIFMAVAGGAGKGIWLHHSNKTNCWEYQIKDESNNSKVITVADSETPTGWHFFTIKWKSTEAKLFVDGALKGTMENPYLPSAIQKIDIGCWGAGNQPNSLIDELRIDKIARSDEEILAAYQSGQPLPMDKWTTYKANFDKKIR